MNPSSPRVHFTLHQNPDNLGMTLRHSNAKHQYASLSSALISSGRPVHVRLQEHVILRPGPTPTHCYLEDTHILDFLFSGPFNVSSM
jgi:hypothetical protein